MPSKPYHQLQHAGYCNQCTSKNECDNLASANVVGPSKRRHPHPDNRRRQHRDWRSPSPSASALSSHRFQHRPSPLHSDSRCAGRRRWDREERRHSATVAVTIPKPARRNEQRHPWFTAELALLIAVREKAHRKWLANKRRHKDDRNWAAFRQCRQHVSTVRRTLRDDYLANALCVDRFAPMPWQTKGIACILQEESCVFFVCCVHSASGCQLRWCADETRNDRIRTGGSAHFHLHARKSQELRFFSEQILMFYYSIILDVLVGNYMIRV